MSIVLHYGGVEFDVDAEMVTEVQEAAVAAGDGITRFVGVRSPEGTTLRLAVGPGIPVVFSGPESDFP